jgi:hypothetical protein
MKKSLLIALLAYLPLSLSAETPPIEAHLAQNNEQYSALVGYNLDLRMWPETRENVAAGLPTLSMHGFGASPTTMVEWLRNAGPYKIPGDVVTFRFADAADDKNMPDFAHFNLGQKKDMLSAFVALKAMQDCTVEKSGWNTHGQSRGAATTINALAAFNQPVDTWHEILKKSQITEAERLSILESVKKGIVVIETPLLTTSSGIHGNGKLWINKHVKKYTGLELPGVMLFPVGELANYVGFPMKSYGNGNYSPWGEQALSSVDRLPEGLKVLVHLQYNDKDVSNDHDRIFVEKLIQRLGKDNVWVVLGNDGGKKLDDETWKVLEKAKEDGVVSKLSNPEVRAHNAGPETLLKKGVISALYKKHGGAYVNDGAHLAQGEKILERSRLCHENIAKYFKDYDCNEKIV